MVHAVTFYQNHKIKLEVKMYETNSEITKNQYLQDKDMTEEEILKLGFKEIKELPVHPNLETVKNGTIEKSLARGR